jgi:glycosyltransferase involved in cell wall biosynthesis
MSLWVDVTSLLSWQGKPTGIPRVAGSLLHEWRAAGVDRLRCCRYEPSAPGFIEVPEPAVADWLARNMGPSAGPSAAVIGPPPAVPPSRLSVWKKQVKETLKPAYLLLPKRLRIPLKESAYCALRQARAGMHRGRAALGTVRRAVAGLRRSRPPAVPTVDFGPSDVLFSAGVSWSFPDFGGVVYGLKRRMGFRFVPLVYDMIPHRFPHFFGPGLATAYQAWAADVLWAADLVVTISESSRQDVLRFAEQAATPPPPVEVVRLGDNLPVDPAGGLPAQVAGLTEADSFVLTVGTVEVRKNHLLVYQIWRRLLEVHGSRVPRLVIVGRPGWLTGDLLYQIHGDPLTRDRLLVLSDATDAELEWLYRHCLFTVYPSHYEGWGLPIAESLCHGKYCVASRASSMPEIGGDLVGYHDSLDVQGFLRLVSEALFDGAFRARREAEIRARYRSTPWSQTAAEVLGHIGRHCAAAPLAA